MLSRDHYAVLGVAPDAGGDEIEAAYRRLCRRYHPDLNPGDPRAEAAFERIKLAYRVLTDERERERYDREGRPVADDIEVSAGAAPAGAREVTHAELFRRLCDQARRARPARGGDVHATVRCRLVDVERGRRTTVAVRRLLPCAYCGGRGRVVIDEAAACASCHGSGRQVFTRGTLNVAVACADCNGEGTRRGLSCPQCHAAGLINVNETIAVQIPAGVLDGQEVRIPAAGHAGRRGGVAGDLIVTVRLEEHPRFERRGPHLVTSIPVSVADAVLGGRRSVPTLEGEPASLRIPPGMHGGEELRVRGRGLEMADGRRGDLFVRLEIWVPKVVDEDAKRLIREFGRRTAEPARGSASHATVQR